PRHLQLAADQVLQDRPSRQHDHPGSADQERPLGAGQGRPDVLRKRFAPTANASTTKGCAIVSRGPSYLEVLPSSWLGRSASSRQMIRPSTPLFASAYSKIECVDRCSETTPGAGNGHPIVFRPASKCLNQKWTRPT